MKQVHYRSINQFRRSVKTVVFLDTLRKLMGILSKGANIDYRQVQRLHLPQRDVIEDTKARGIPLEGTNDLRVLGGGGKAEVRDIGKELFSS